MNDAECARFLQWALPRMGLRWAGFRKVRRGVCKRVARRARSLGLAGLAAYRARLEAHPGEWSVLDALCRVTISRFLRDRGMWRRLEEEVLPRLAEDALAGGEEELLCWSAGCASGEEPYSLALLWRLGCAERFPALRLRVLATEADPRLLERARRGAYAPASLKELPREWVGPAFAPAGRSHLLKDAFREGVKFFLQDIRREAPGGIFRLILCRNLAFTYFAEDLQREVLRRLLGCLAPGGFLAIGAHESLPEGAEELPPWPGCPQIFRRGK